MSHGLEVVPRKVAEYRGTRLTEMDTGAVLRRHPKVALIGELAHTNVPGSGGHEKRWQDVMDILADEAADRRESPRAGAGLGSAQGQPD